MNEISIYNYQDYRLFLKDYLQQKRNKGLSYRQLSRLCDITSPGYFKEHIDKKKKMSLKVARKVVKGFELSKLESRYFLALVQLKNTMDPKELKGIKKELDRVVKLGEATIVDDSDFFSSWLHGPLRQLFLLKNFEPSIKNAAKRLKRIANQREITESWNFLLKKGYIKKNSQGKIERKNVEITIKQDKKNLDFRKNHDRFLDLAKHQLCNKVSEREFQSLTIAIREDQFPEVKKQIRKFIDDLNADLTHIKDPDRVLHVELCAFFMSD